MACTWAENMHPRTRGRLRFLHFIAMEGGKGVSGLVPGKIGQAPGAVAAWHANEGPGSVLPSTSRRDQSFGRAEGTCGAGGLLGTVLRVMRCTLESIAERDEDERLRIRPRAKHNIQCM